QRPWPTAWRIRAGACRCSSISRSVFPESAMHGYSDRIHHALSYLAKHYHPHAPADQPLPFVAQPYNLIVILARHGADEITLVAGILHHLIEIAPPPE